MFSMPADLWLEMTPPFHSLDSSVPLTWTWASTMTPSTVRNAWQTLIPALESILTAWPVPDSVSITTPLLVEDAPGRLALSWQGLSIPPGRVFPARIPVALCHLAVMAPRFFARWTLSWEFDSDDHLCRFRLIIKDGQQAVQTVRSCQPPRPQGRSLLQ